MVQVDQVSGTGGDEKLLENNIEAELRQDYLTSSNRQDIIILAKDQESCGDRSRSPKQAGISFLTCHQLPLYRHRVCRLWDMT